MFSKTIFLKQVKSINNEQLNKVKKTYSKYFIFLLPILVSFLFELVLTHIYIERVYNFIENILFLLVLILPAFLIKKNINRKRYFKLVFVYYMLMLFIETGYYLIFNSKLNASSLFILSETHLNETKEFLSFYLNKRLLVFLFLMILIIVIFFRKINNVSIGVIDGYKKKSILMSFTFLIISLFLISHTRRENLPYTIVKSFYDLNRDSYFDDKENYGDVLGPFKKSTDYDGNSKETIVIVIGESISKLHLSIYGYKRNTTPHLNRIEDDILIYNDVISPNALTTESLSKALTLNKSKGSIIQLLNSSGFETYWLSNQNPIGVFESLVSKISKASSDRRFLTTSRFVKNTIYDEELLPRFKKILDNKIRRKVIFIHMQGAHFDYKYRYPKKYKFFNDIPFSTFASNENKYDIINHYDNAILYHDFVLGSIISIVKNKNDSCAILYFSDHGEEVYDTMNFSGHSDDVGSLPMFEIPFVLWQSESFKEKHNFVIDLDRPYTTDCLFHSIADLSGLSNSSYIDIEKSIFSKEFKKRKRFISNNKDYDSLSIIKNK